MPASTDEATRSFCSARLATQSRYRIVLEYTYTYPVGNTLYCTRSGMKHAVTAVNVYAAHEWIDLQCTAQYPAVHP